METAQETTERSGMGEVLRLSWPASLSMLNSQLMRFVDGRMVSFIGPVPFGAQMVAGLSAFVPESFATGLLTVVNTYVSQNLGARRLDQCGRYGWAGVLLALMAGVMIVPLVFFARPIFHLLDQPAEMIDLEVMYFRYMVAAVFLTLTARPLEQFFYGIHRPMVVLVPSLIAHANNIVMGYILIFGAFGAPRMGLEGSAVATVVSWAIHLTILSCMFLSAKVHERYKTRRPHVSLRQLGEIVKVGWPAGMEFFSDVLPWSVMLSVLVGRFGPAHVAASSAAMRWMPLSFMPAVGIGVATTAIVGKYIGQGRTDLARRRTHTALKVALAYMGICAVTFWLLRYPMISLFVNVGPAGDLPTGQAHALADQIIGIGSWVLVCAAVFQLFDAVGIVYVGALRGAGDTFWPMVCTVLLSWGFIFGGGYVMISWFPQLTSIGPWVAASLYVIVLGLTMAVRFERGSWKNIDLLGLRTPPASGFAATKEAPLRPPPEADDLLPRRPDGR